MKPITEPTRLEDVLQELVTEHWGENAPKLDFDNKLNFEIMEWHDPPQDASQAINVACSSFGLDTMLKDGVLHVAPIGTFERQSSWAIP